MFLWGITVAPDGTVWAVGAVDSLEAPGVVLRLQGGRFVQLPVPRGTEELRGIAAPAAHEAWAVAMNGILRWDGHRWKRSSAPIGSHSSISADAPDDVWAVGTTASGLLVVHWDGKTWTRVPFGGTPSAAHRSSGGGVFVSFSNLDGVLARAPEDVWVGGTVTPERRPMR